MNVTGKIIFGAILLLIGGNILLSTLGIHLGGLLGVAFAGLLIWYGYSKMKTAETKGAKTFGTIILIFGILMLIGKAHMIVGMVIAGAIIYYGIKLVKRETQQAAPTNHSSDEDLTVDFKADDSFEHEWKRFIEKHN
ncbi:LiaF transmembrane domain-containing protein [Bacillus alkalicellulosilyticus]|uniref:LiaF transmembrane domain-containing protein n=1 Tax=Alkalihalobacterium alkalicellulosilyticum TaxID=1912214 RepID=UPI00099698C3|nr:hypothetical protein [Bacillus alkalicellulosilyticus]